MERQDYTLVRDGRGWAFNGPHELSATYLNKNDAFDAAVAAMRQMLSQGDAMALTIPGGERPWGAAIKPKGPPDA